ncbi:MAG: alpha/beta hydrolase, partial [Cyclobacteriaceae bacterium]|nr:alpha/beta hydrolase [Cyclobacteriaceae bacterium]
MKPFFLWILLLPLIGHSQNYRLPLWPGPIPNALPSPYTQQADTNGIVRIRQVITPTLEVYLPAASRATGQAVVICPGGGYGILAYDWEGTDIAKWLNTHGIAGIVLKYRLPDEASNAIPHQSP